MTDREKLIELIGATPYGNNSLVGENFQEGFIARIADHLIANGVTIPVRCKDCKNADDYPANVYPFKTTDSQKLVCTKTVNWRAVEQDHFCAYGERRTE